LQFIWLVLVVSVALLRLVVVGLWFGFRAIPLRLVGWLGSCFLVVLCGGVWVVVGWFTAYPDHLPLVKYKGGFVATFKKNTPFFVATFEIINLTL
jgi:hypothetical protein